jgi:hypothetical protein
MPNYRVDRLTTTDELGPSVPYGTIEAENPNAAVSRLVLRTKVKEAPPTRSLFIVTQVLPEGATAKQVAAHARLVPTVVRYGWGRR